MTKNRSPGSVINCRVLVFTTPRVQFTFAESAFYLLVFILHLACVLPSPQTAVFIFRKTQQAPGPRVISQTSRPRLFHKPRDPVFSIDPRDPGTPEPRTPVPHYPLNRTNDRDGYSHRRSIFWKTLLFSLPSLLDFLTFVVLILSNGDCNVDISE